MISNDDQNTVLATAQPPSQMAIHSDSAASTSSTAIGNMNIQEQQLLQAQSSSASIRDGNLFSFIHIKICSYH